MKIVKKADPVAADIIDTDNDYTDYSRNGCHTRRVSCKGKATVQHPKRKTANREARAEAKRQYDSSVANAQRDITCPSGGCSGGTTCSQVGNWFYGGGPVGQALNSRKIILADGSKVWESTATRHKEIRLKCRCR